MMDLSPHNHAVTEPARRKAQTAPRYGKFVKNKCLADAIDFGRQLKNTDLWAPQGSGLFDGLMEFTHISAK
jgi:hypothetical protein